MGGVRECSREDIPQAETRFQPQEEITFIKHLLCASTGLRFSDASPTWVSSAHHWQGVQVENRGRFFCFPGRRFVDLSRY